MTQKSSSRTRHQRHAGKTRERLVRAANCLFSEKGFDAVTIDEITQRTNLGKGTFYYHFKTKDQLYKELVRRVLSEPEQAIIRHCKSCADLYRPLDDIILAHRDFFKDRRAEFVRDYQGRLLLRFHLRYWLDENRLSVMFPTRFRYNNATE
jgi:AcrR family transcriptional regulator